MSNSNNNSNHNNNNNNNTATATSSNSNSNSNNIGNNTNGSCKEREEERVVQVVKGASKKTETEASGEEDAAGKGTEDPMEEDSVNPATVFCIRLKQPRSNMQYKMSVPELCRNFRYGLR